MPSALPILLHLVPADLRRTRSRPLTRTRERPANLGLDAIHSSMAWWSSGNAGIMVTWRISAPRRPVLWPPDSVATPRTTHRTLLEVGSPSAANSPLVPREPSRPGWLLCPRVTLQLWTLKEVDITTRLGERRTIRGHDHQEVDSDNDAPLLQADSDADFFSFFFFGNDGK